MKTSFKTIEHKVDVCVVGGGLSGICAAISAARHGAKVLIMQDRPMFGGNASSEIRMWVCGARGENNRETGLIEEIMLESFYRNPYCNYSIWDSILFEKIRYQSGLDYLLNCSCLDAETDNNLIFTIKGWQLTTQTYHVVQADIFIDCSGDSILAPLTGAEYRSGRESRYEFDETIAPENSDNCTMGMSCIIQAREYNEMHTYIPPFWAEKFTADKLPYRLPNPMDKDENYWYIELGGEQDTITGTEKIRDELQNAAYGIWNYVKNSGDYGPEVDRLDMDWVGILPGKRESRRYVGDYIMNQNDIQSGGRFDDLIAYGGWPMDDHHPAGLRGKEKPTIFHQAPSPYGIPYRCLYSKNIENLMFAGRNISVTHVALSSTRVMATCSVIGQAAGTAAALAIQNKTKPRGIYEQHIRKLQMMLMNDDCYLPFHQRPIPELTKSAILKAGGTNAENLRNGYDRPIGSADNGWIGYPGDSVTYYLPKKTVVKKARFIFDSDLNRLTLPDKPRYNRPQRANYFLNDKPMCVPKTMMRDFRIDLCREDNKWQTWQLNKNNYQRLVNIDLSSAGPVMAVRFVPLSTWGSANYHLFSFDLSEA